jgi:hypothetical protein
MFPFLQVLFSGFGTVVSTFILTDRETVEPRSQAKHKHGRGCERERERKIDK